MRSALHSWIEILETFLNLRFGLLGHIKFNEKVLQNSWDSEINQWRVRTESGQELLANVIIAGSGALHVPKMPDFPGMESFQGQSFHTALWRKDFDPRGERVGVVGTGASAVQAVPALAAQGVARLTVFQRTPCWAPPRMDFRFPEVVKRLFALLPLTNTLFRWHLFWTNELRFKLLFVKDGWIAKGRSHSSQGSLASPCSLGDVSSGSQTGQRTHQVSRQEQRDREPADS